MNKMAPSSRRIYVHCYIFNSIWAQSQPNTSSYTNNQLVINSTTPLPCLIANTFNSAKRARRKDARPGELLEAALALFVEKGFTATRAEEVAQRAGVSKGTLFLYFASKEELFKAVVRENISKHYPEWHAALEAYEGSTADMLRQCVSEWWTRVGSTQASGISKIMMTEGYNFPDLVSFYQREVIEPGNAMIRRILQRGVDSGEFGPIDMKYSAYLVLSPMLFLVMWKHSFGSKMPNPTDFVPADFLAAQVETLLQGLTVRPPSPQTHQARAASAASTAIVAKVATSAAPNSNFASHPTALKGHPRS